MNLAYHYPIIFWDTANLIVDSGAMNITEEILNNSEEEDEKIKNSSTDYGRIAAAIGKMKTRGLNFSLPDINKSAITFSPQLNENLILYGLRGITRVGNDLIKQIFENRPYTSLEDFITKNKPNKTQIVSLIKAGTFDSLYDNDRIKVMNKYLNLISDKKKKITLQNMQMLITKNMIPIELDFEKRLFNFNKYLKKNKEKDLYFLDNIAMNFYSRNYDTNNLINIKVKDDETTAYIYQEVWDKIYKKDIEPVRIWMKANQQEILDNLNNNLFKETREKYAEGNISKWEMDSLSFYYHDHELKNLQTDLYEIEDYFKLSDEPEVDKIYPDKRGGQITLFKIHRIAGTVIDKDKNKNTITLLTTKGVVIVKIWKNQFTKWDKQISEKNDDGTRSIVEKSWFQRGTKLIITGIKRENTFIPKKYKNTEWPLFEKIISINDKGIITEKVDERIEVDE